MRVVTANVNGIRAAARRGGLEWLARADADVVALQEVRADEDQLHKALADAGLGHWHLAQACSSTRGHAGVAVLSRLPLLEVRPLPPSPFGLQGRWVEADVETSTGAVTVASTYVHTGEAGTTRQDEKYAFLATVEDRLAAWTRAGRSAVLAGDLNIAHTAEDLKNWKGNLGRAGFLEEERATLDRWLGLHVVDVHRHLHGPGPGPYSWWSWRGRAFDNDAGWRIDYQLATPPLADRAVSAFMGRAETYALRWSDHAPVVVDYDLGWGTRR